MSVIAAVKAWLRDFPDLAVAPEIDTDQLAADATAMGLYSAPGDTEITFVDGSRDHTKHYLLAMRRPSQTDDLRAGNREELEALERWVRDQNLRGMLPELGAGRLCYCMEFAGAFELKGQDDGETIYSVTLAIRYFEEV